MSNINDHLNSQLILGVGPFQTTWGLGSNTGEPAPVPPEFEPTPELREGVAGVATGSEGPKLCAVAVDQDEAEEPPRPSQAQTVPRPGPKIISIKKQS